MSAAHPKNLFDYETLVARNSGYIPADVQEKIRTTTLLIAGCGMGSGAAICAARMGFARFILVDGDTVSASNLNRQFYDFADVGQPKVHALKQQILRINPEAEVEAVNAFLDTGNTDALIARADVIFDTVDFLDLPAILSLHNGAKQQCKPLLTALNVGFGGIVWYFPPDTAMTLPEALAPDMAAVRAATGAEPNYVDVYASFVGRLKPFLDAEVVAHIGHVLHMMKDGTPCPASQVAPGSFTVAAMALSMIRDMLSGDPVPSSPTLLIHSFKTHETRNVDISQLV